MTPLSKRQLRNLRRWHGGRRRITCCDIIELSQLGLIEYDMGPLPDGGFEAHPVLSDAGRTALGLEATGGTG